MRIMGITILIITISGRVIRPLKTPELFNDDYYRVNLKGLMASVYAENELFKNGAFKVGLLFENLDSRTQTDSVFYEDGQRIPGADRVTLGGLNARFYLDFRDSEVFATSGLQFLAENTTYLTLEGAAGEFRSCRNLPEVFWYRESPDSSHPRC